MNQKQLYYFSKVYEHHSVSEAAKELFISHQGLSKTILALENDLGLKLFDRMNNQMIPTIYAVNLYPHAQNILEEFSLIENQQFISESGRKNLKILCSFDAIEIIPTAFFHHFSTHYPEILLHIEEMSDLNIIEELANGNTQLAILPGPLDVQKYHIQHLFDANFCLLINKDNPLSQKERILYKDLTNHKIIFKGTRTPLDIIQINTFEQNGWKPDILMEVSDSKLMFRLVYDNYGIAMTLDYLAQNADSEKTIARPFDPALTKSVYLVHNKGNVLCHNAALFQKELLSWIARHPLTDTGQS